MSQEKNSFTKDEYRLLSNRFLIETEDLDKRKPSWMTKNHVENLYVSLNEFYLWLEKNYWDIKQDENEK